MDILLAVLPVFLVIATGGLLRRLKLVDDAFVDSSNSVVYFFLLPALLFLEIGSSDFRESFRPLLIVGAYAATVAVFILAFVISHRLPSPAARGSFVQGTFRANLAYVGLPIALSVGGPAGFRMAGILLGFLVPLINSLAVVALLLPHRAKGTGLREEAGRVARAVVTNPIFLGALSGIVWSMAGIGFPSLVRGTLKLLTSATLPLSLLAIGASFSIERVRSAGIGLAASASAMKLLLVPLIGLAIYKAAGLPPDEMRIGAIMLGCPTAVITWVMAARMEGDTDLAASIVLMTTAASCVTISAWLLLLRAAG